MTSPAAAAELRRITTVAVAVALTLAALKGGVYAATSSVALLSSFLDSLIDGAASFLNLLAVRHALTPADEEHRFGHGKAEPLAALAQSTMIAVSVVILATESLKRFADPQPVPHADAAIAVMVVSMVATFALVYWQRRVARRTGSLAVGADSLHYASDLATNGAIIAAIAMAGWFGWAWADPVMALLVALFMGWGVAKIFREAWSHLMDRELPDEARERIKSIARAHPECRAIHDLRTRAAGLRLFIQFHLELDADMSLRRAHDVADEVEAALLAAFPGAEIIIHQDPEGVDERRPAISG